MLSKEKLEKIANLHLQVAIVKGERWAVEVALGIKKELVISGDKENKPKWEIEIHHVGGNNGEISEDQPERITEGCSNSENETGSSEDGDDS